MPTLIQRYDSALLSKLREMGIKSLENAEIDRCLIDTVGYPNLKRRMDALLSNGLTIKSVYEAI